MLVVFTLYWAFFTWLFSNSTMFASVEFFMNGLFRSACSTVVTGPGCNLGDLIANFPAFIALIISVLLILGGKKDTA